MNNSIVRKSKTGRRALPLSQRAYVVALYLLALLREFRLTLLSLAAAVVLGAILYAITPHDAMGGQRPSLLLSLYGGWMAMLAQPLTNPPQTWYLTVLCGVYPLLGAILVGEGVVRLALLMMSRRRGEKEWIQVMASTYRDHVVLCGLGHLGFRVLQALVASNVPVVVLERHREGKFVAQGKELGVPVLIRDMKEQQALIDAGIMHARAVIIATNDAVANLEVALDSRRMNPGIRVVMRMFDEQVAAKISAAMSIDVAFSSSSLAAPVIAALALQNGSAKVLATFTIADVPHVTVELPLAAGSKFVGQRIAEIESSHSLRILAHIPKGAASQSPRSAETVLGVEDRVVIHAPVAQLSSLL
jgi:voltage-gated potassium channel